MSRFSRRAIAVVGVLAVAPLMSACAAGQHPQSALPTQLAEGVNASVHQIDVRNVFLLGPVPGQQLAAGGSAPLYAWFVNNDASAGDRLVSAQAPGTAQSVEITGGGINLPAQQLVNTVQSPVATPPAVTPGVTPSKTPAQTKGRTGKKGAKTPTQGANSTPTPTGAGTAPTGTVPAQQPSPSLLTLKGLARTFTGGETFKLTLNFQRAGAVTLNVPVVQRNGAYQTYSPVPSAPTPTPTPTPTSTATPPTSQSKSARKDGKSTKSGTKAHKRSTTTSAH